MHPQLRTDADGSDPLNLCAMRRLMRRSKNAALFDDLVGPSEQRWGNSEPECPRRLEINC